MTRYICGARLSVVAISWPQVRLVAPVRISPSENSPSGNDDGLKMWTRRPSFSQRIRSFAANPSAISRNWK